MKLLLSGASGLIGSALRGALTAQGHSIFSLTRAVQPGNFSDILWDPDRGILPADRLEGMDAVIHLSGESIAGRWTARKKERILNSRVQGTRLLTDAMLRLKAPPSTFLCASAVGYYGDRGDETLTESSPPGNGFLPEVCRAWEAEAARAADRGIRVVHLRFGIVLSREGGALGAMLPAFRAGLGGRLGGGNQWVSWVARDEIPSIVRHILETPALHGPLNITSPCPLPQKEFAKLLGMTIRRPTVFPTPACLIRLFLGEMGEALLLSSVRDAPEKLLRSGYRFLFSSLESALQTILKVNARSSGANGGK